MSDNIKVVARFQDGRVLKGTTHDFFPNRPTFHLRSAGGGSILEIKLDVLKAVFFVKDFEGNSEREDLKGFAMGPRETSQGKRVIVRFRDGEVFFGYTLGYTPGRQGFFVFPADAGSNNLRAFVLASATVEILTGQAADLACRALVGQAR